MHPRKIIARFILWMLYIASLVILTIDLRFGMDENCIFYYLSNLTLVYRLLGCWYLPFIIHNICVFYCIYYFATIKYHYCNVANAVLCCVVVVVQILLSLHFVVFRPGRSKSQRACRVGFHALVGIMTIIIYYWIICFYINPSNFQCLLEMGYMFLYLCMILTPQFMTHHQAGMQARLDMLRHMHLQNHPISDRASEQPRSRVSKPTPGTSKNSPKPKSAREKGLTTA